MQNVFLCVSGECTMNPRTLCSPDSFGWWYFLAFDVNWTHIKLLIVYELDGHAFLALALALRLARDADVRRSQILYPLPHQWDGAASCYAKALPGARLRRCQVLG